MVTCEKSIIPIDNINYCCDISDITQLNETKRYTLLASELISEICRDVRLTASSVKLWHYLYVKASLTPKLEISISYNELSIILNKSLRTICRYVSTLKKYGYLLIKNNFNKNGQTINTFCVRLPKPIINRVKETKDRSKNIQTVIKENSDFVISSELQHEDNVPKKVAEKIDVKNESQNNLDRNLTNNSFNKVSSKSIVDTLNNTQINKNESIKIYESLRHESAIECTKEVMRMNQKADDKLDIPRYDKFGSRKTTSINSLLNNSAKSRFNTSSGLINIQNRNVIFNNVKEMTRVVNAKQKEKILYTLTSIGFHEHESLKLTQEIIFAIEYDSLREKPVNYAINIALKLIKLNRWTTPCKMRKPIII